MFRSIFLGCGCSYRGGFDSRCRVVSSDLRAAEDMLAPLPGGEAAEGGILEPRHCAACEGTVTVVTVAAFVLDSVVFCRANFKRCDRFGLDGICVDEPRPEMDIAVESDPCSN